VQTSRSERISAIISAVLIADGIALTIADGMRGSRNMEHPWRTASSRKKKGTL
jgi:hypothetical protein